MTFISERKKIRRTGMSNIYPVFNPPVHSFNVGRGEFYLFLSGIAVFRQGILRSVKKNPTLAVHHIYVLHCNIV